MLLNAKHVSLDVAVVVSSSDLQTKDLAFRHALIDSHDATEREKIRLNVAVVLCISHARYLQSIKRRTLSSNSFLIRSDDTSERG